MTDLDRRRRLREERMGLLRVVPEYEIQTRIETTYNGRQVPMSLVKLSWLDRADATIKRLDAKTRA